MTGEKTHLLITTRYAPPPGGCTCISICAMIHHMDTRVTVVTRNKICHLLAGHHGRVCQLDILPDLAGGMN